MARRITESQLEKQRQRRVVIFSIFMIALLVFSTFAYYIGSAPTDQGNMEYGDYEFAYAARPEFGQDAAVLITEIDGQEVEFQSLPPAVSAIDVDPRAVPLMRDSTQFILSADPSMEDDQAWVVDYVRLQLGLAIPKAVNGMTAEDDRYRLPVFTCDDATAQLPVVVFNVTNTTQSVVVDGSCIIVNGEGRELMLIKDRMIFEYVGIMQDGAIVDG